MGGHRGGPATDRPEGVETGNGAGRRAADRESAPHRGNEGPQSDRGEVIVIQGARPHHPRSAHREAERGVREQGLYSQRVITHRKELLPQMREARERGKVAYLSFDKLVVKDYKLAG